MLCQKCKAKEANVYYRESVNGKTKTYSLCEDCAHELEEQGVLKTDTFGSFGLGGMPNFVLPAFDPAGFFSSLLGSLTGVGAMTSGKRCSLCGSTLSEMTRSGKVGCPQCYTDFAHELESTINRVHGDAVHRGRAPKAWKQKQDRKEQIKTLKQDLSTAISEERFEDAAKLRDQIRGLETGDAGAR